MSTQNLAIIQKAEYEYRKLASPSDLQQDRCQSHLIVVVHHHQVPQAQSPEQLEHSRKRCLLQGNPLPLGHFTPPWEEIQTPKPSISRVLSCSFPSMPDSRPCVPLVGFSVISYHPKPNIFQAVPNTFWSDGPSQDTSPTCTIPEGLLCLAAITPQDSRGSLPPFQSVQGIKPYPSPASDFFGSIST